MNRKETILHLDKVFSKICRERDQHCLLCRAQPTDPHHFVHGRINIKYRFDLRNLIGVCRECHTKIHNGQIKYEEVRAKALYWDIISMDELEEIENDNSINKITTADLQDLLKKVKKNIK